MGVLRGGQDATDLCSVRPPPVGGKAGLPGWRGHAFGGRQDPVDPHEELAAGQGGLDSQVGAGQGIDGDHGADRHQGIARCGLPGNRVVWRVADVLILRLGLTLDGGHQLSDQHRIVRTVVDPPVPEHSVLGGSDQPAGGAGERAGTVGQRHLVGGGPLSGPVG